MNIINDMLVDKCFPDNANARAVVPAYKEKTASGSPITLTDSAESKPFGMKLYGWSKQDGTPSPDNPVEIESAGMKWSTGKNLLDYSIMKSKTAYGVTLKNNNDGTFLLQGVCTTSFNFIADNVVTLKAGTYTIFANANRIAINDNNPCVQLYNSDKGVGVDILNNNALAGFNTKTFVEDIELQYRIRIQKGVNYDGFILKPMLVAGSEILPYEPYTGGIPKPYGDKITVDVCGRNLWNYGDIEFVQNRTIVFSLDAGTYVFTSDVESSDTDADYNLVAFTYEDGKMIFYQINRGKQKSIKVVLTRKTRSITFYASKNNDSGKGDMATFKNIMLSKSAEAFPYEPYRVPQSTSLITPNGLPGIPVPSNTAGITYTDANGQAWIADEIDLERGKYVQRIGKVDLENLLWKLIGNCFRSGAISDSKVYKWTSEIANIICSHYICKMTSYNMQYNSDGQDNLIGMYANQIEIKDTRYNKDVDLFKQSLSGVYAYYVLAIPVERNLTPVELEEYTQLYSYKPTTIIENDSGCWMDVTYKAGTSGKSKNEALRWYFKNVMPLVG